MNYYQPESSKGESKDLDPIINKVGERQIVVIGGSNTGTAEFLEWRNQLSQRLIMEKQFSFVASTSDWQESYRINSYIKGYTNPAVSAQELLFNFQGWPKWKWFNRETVEFFEWLKEYNQSRSEENKAGFFGLDSFNTEYYFEKISDFLSHSLHHEDVTEIQKLMSGILQPRMTNGENKRIVPVKIENDLFDYLTNPLAKLYVHEKSGRQNLPNDEITQNRNRYLKMLFKGNREVNKIRNLQMKDTLESLVKYHGDNNKAIIWADSYQAGRMDETLGQILTDSIGRSRIMIIGMGNFEGETIAAESWGGSGEITIMPKASANSWELYLHRNYENYEYKVIDTQEEVFANILLLSRIMGPVYDPNIDDKYYLSTILSKRYDMFCFFNRTQAIKPLMSLENDDTEKLESSSHSF
ncbi:MAG TPA: erythromycin esterase family protein [Patescibacteria group bacterium]